MGHVYLAEHRQHQGVRFALKVLRRNLVHQATIGDRFRAEAAMLGRLDHPGIVRVHDCFEVDGSVCMVLAYVNGDSLGDRIQAQGALDESVALPMFKTILAALDYAHQAGVIHRDVKPSNILIDRDGQPHLCDFGIAKQVGQRGITAAGMTLGTPQYMSPEQVQAPQSLDHRTDLYSAGIVLYEMLTGKVPFGDSPTESDLAILQQQVASEPPDARIINPKLSDGLAEILQKALRKEPDRRYQGGSEFRRAIEQYEQGWASRDPGSSRMPAADEVRSTHRYAVYEHPTDGRTAIRAGFSWPALCFGLFWMVANRLYWQAALWTVSGGVLGLMIGLVLILSHDSSAWGLVLVLVMVAAAIWALPAIFGHKWLEDALLRSGHVRVGDVSATTADAAIMRAPSMQARSASVR